MFSPDIRPITSVPPPHDPFALRPAAPVEPLSPVEVEEEEEDLPTAGLVMRRQVVVVTPSTTLRELALVLTRNRISGVPVVDPQTRELLGLVSQADLAAHLAGACLQTETPSYYQGMWFEVGPEEAEGTVADIMTPYVYYATEDTSVPEVVDLMLEHGIHRVVVTRSGMLVGVVTTMDLLRYLRPSLG